MDRGYSSWTCIEVGPVDTQGLRSARLTVLVTPSCPHNRVAEITPDLICFEVGAPKKEGRAIVELMGYLGFLFNLEEKQIRLESGLESIRRQKHESKIVVLSGISRDKRELIWFFEKQIGKRHEAHFSADNVNSAKNQSCEQAVKRRREQIEYQTLLAEVKNAASADSAASLLSAGAPARSKKAIGPSSRELLTDAKGATEVVAPEQATLAASNVDTPVATPGAAAAAECTSSMGGLAAYDSDSGEDDDEDEDRPALPKPFL